MSWVDLGVPVPRERPQSYEPVCWSTNAATALEVPPSTGQVDLMELLDGRRTWREFGKLNLTQLSTLLWMVARVQSTAPSALGFPLTFGPTPSAGAIHPIHILVGLPEASYWSRYDPIQHSLNRLEGGEIDTVRLQVSEVVPTAGDATIILLAAEPGKTMAKYTNASSLVWRDAGVLLGLLSVACEALNQSFCALGLTGEPWVGQLDKQGRLSGVGVAVVGSRL